jgi:hypothetical protein
MHACSLNSKLREKGKKEEGRRLREFVDAAYRLDPRVAAHRAAQVAERYVVMPHCYVVMPHRYAVLLVSACICTEAHIIGGWHRHRCRCVLLDSFMTIICP